MEPLVLIVDDDESLRMWSAAVLRAAGYPTLQAADADDLTQQVLTVVVRKLPAFRHSGRPGAFRAWLRAITVSTTPIADAARYQTPKPLSKSV